METETDLPRILVTGATGNLGLEVVAALRARGAIVREALHSTGASATAVPLDFENPTTFPDAVEGCDAMFLLRPPAIADTKRTLNVMIDVARASGVQHIVFISVAGAANNRFVPPLRRRTALACRPR
jgi:uncharacterized protein YbjT (DUF2867 family)